MKKKYISSIAILLICVLCVSIDSGCNKRTDATNNIRMTSETSSKEVDEATKSKDTKPTETEDATVEYESKENEIIKKSSSYNCNISKDKKSFDGHVNITVGDNLYATQINDWYMHFDEYKDKVVEIEGYYLGDFAPYDFIGRNGPSCPYCQGGYVCFEILTDVDVSEFKSGNDWIKVVGILREGNDSKQGTFYYIETLSLKKMDSVGKDTVSN